MGLPQYTHLLSASFSSRTIASLRRFCILFRQIELYIDLWCGLLQANIHQAQHLHARELPTERSQPVSRVRVVRIDSFCTQRSNFEGDSSNLGWTHCRESQKRADTSLNSIIAKRFMTTRM
jgi:hypothetical protein